MTYPVLYLFPRTDLDSMNPGKAMAHTAHGANAFVHAMRQEPDLADRDPELMATFTAWENATPQGFGTTIVLQATWNDMKTVNQILSTVPGVSAGLSTDPTYPYVVSNEVADLIPESVDTMPRHPGAPGQTVMYRSEVTCVWVFGMKDNPRVESALRRFNLHP